MAGTSKAAGQLRGRPPGKYALKCYAGCKPESAEPAQGGFRVALPMDKTDGYDFTVPAFLAEILRWIRKKQLWLVCLAAPCTSWSQAQAVDATTAARTSGTARTALRILRPALRT